MLEVEGIIIKSTPFRENDAMITMISSDRLYSFLAKGVLKFSSKNASSVSLFSKSLLTLTRSKEGLSLRSGLLLESFNLTNASFKTLVSIQLIGEITSTLIIQKDECKAIYLALEKIFSLFNNGFSSLTLSLLYFAYVLKTIGYGINVDKCVKCGRKQQIISVSYEDGGFICQNCFDPYKHKKVTKRKLQIIRYIFKVEPDYFNRIEFSDEECLSIINELSEFVCLKLDLRLTTIKLLSKI